MPRVLQNMRADASRRRFVAMAAACLSAGVNGARAQTATNSALCNSPNPISGTSNSGTSNSGNPNSGNPNLGSLAAYRDTADHLTIEVRVNEAGPFRFVVDTGAESSVLSDTVATQLGLQPSGRAMVQGIISKIPADLVHINGLAYGPFSKRDLVLPVLPRQLLQADGYLGLDAISDSRITFDFRNHLLTLESPQSHLPYIFANAAQTVLIDVRGTAGRLRASHCDIDGVRAAAFIDTGAEVSIGNQALMDALTRRHHPDLGPILLTGVTGGQVEGRLISVSAIRVQELSFTNGTLVISDSPNFDDWGLAHKPAMLIGMDFLRQFAKVTIDYRFQEIRFELASMPENTEPTRIASV